MKQFSLFGLFLTFMMGCAHLGAQTPNDQIQPVLTPADVPALNAWYDGAGATAACEGAEIVVDADSTVDFSVAEAVFQGDPDLAPFFSYEKQGDDPSAWKAVFDLGARRLRIAAGATLTVNNVTWANGAATPGLEIRSTCGITVAGVVRLQGNNADTGALTLLSAGDLVVSGTVSNSIQGTWGATGVTSLAVGSGDLRVTSTGSVLQKGPQQGAHDLFLLAFKPGGDLDLSGVVEASFDYNLSPNVHLAAFEGAVTIDGTRLLGSDPSGRRLSTGVRLRSNVGYAVGDLSLLAKGDVTINGYGSFDQSGDSVSFTLDTPGREGGQVIPTTVTMTNLKDDVVQVNVSIPDGSGRLRAYFGNIHDESRLEATRIEGSNLTRNRFINANAVDGISDYWMNPPGGWDYGQGIGSSPDVLTSTSFTISAPGLNWEQLLVAQRDFLALGVIIQPGSGFRGKAEDLVGMVLPSPYFADGIQDGTVAVKSKGDTNPGGNLTVQSITGRIVARDRAFDNVNGSNAGKTLKLEAFGDIDLSVTDPQIAAMLGGRPVVDSRFSSGQSGAGNLIRSYRGSINVGERAGVLTGDAGGNGAPNRLTACSGVKVSGSVLPADAEPGDDTGFCPPPLVLTVENPVDGALVNHLPLVVNGAVTPADATVNVNGTTVTATAGVWSHQLTLDEGPATIIVSATDGVDQVEARRTVTVDTLPPTLALNGPTSVVMGEMFELSWTTVDASAVTVTLTSVGDLLSNESSGSLEVQVPYDPDLTELVYTLTGEDVAGNVAEAQTLTVQVLRPDLLIEFTQPAEGFATAADSVLVAGAVSPAETPVHLNGTPAAVTGNQWELELPLTTQGEIVLTAEMVSPLGTQTATRSIFRDVTPPVLNLQVPEAVDRGQTYTVTWSALDDRAIGFVELQQDGVVIADTADGSLELTVPQSTTAETIAFQLIARDDLGNEAALNAAVPISRPDLVLTLNEPAEGTYTNLDTITVSGTVSPQGAAVTVNGAAAVLTRTGWSAQIALDIEGPIELTVVAQLLGETATQTRTIVRDTTAPTLTLNAPDLAQPGSAFSFDWSAVDTAPLVSTAVTRDGELVSEDAVGTASYEVPLSTTATQIQLVLTATDAAGNTGSTQATVNLIDPADLDPVVITLTSPAHGDLFGAAGVTVTGNVAPINASLFLDGQPVTVNPDGRFNLETTLATGINTLIFHAEASGYRPGRAKLDLFLDDIDPVVTISSPTAGLMTNLAEVTILGAVSDQYDTDPTLARDGNPIAIRGGRFEERVTLQPGENVFTYIATDQLGHTGSASITVVYSGDGPQITLTHPARILPGESFQLDVSFEPAAEITRADVYVNHQAVHGQDNGTAYSGSFSAASGARDIPISVTAIDIYGNRSEALGLVQISYPHYVYGKVLDDTTSYPLGGLPVQIVTPMGETQLVTDENGGYQAYVHGYPVDVMVTTAAYAPIHRHMPMSANSWRAPDLRLTPQGPSGGAPGSLSHHNLTVITGAGLSGDARLTTYGSQGIPELLPPGYAPVTAFDLSDVTGNGAIDLQLGDLPELPAGTGMIVLQREGRAWRVQQHLSFNADGAWRIDNGAAGSWLLAVRDTATTTLPALNTLLQRDTDPVVPPNTLADSLTEPARVSVRDEPQTQFTCVLAGNGALTSGVRARLTAREVHERYSETIVVPDYNLDFYAYSIGFDSPDQAANLGGSLSIRARHEVVPERTQRAEIAFYSRPGTVEQAVFLDSPVQQIGDLTLDFSDTAATPRVVHAQQSTARVPAASGVTQIAGFALTIGGDLDNSAALALEAPNAAAMLLLRQRDGEQSWAFVGQLTRDGATWRNPNAALTTGGHYAVVAVDYAICEVSGTVRNGGSGVADVVLGVSGMAWNARGNADGSYRLALAQTAQAQVIHAEHSALRRAGDLTLASTAGRTQLSGQDIELSTRDFDLLRHEPEADAIHVSLLPQIILEFNRPVSDDAAQLAAQIQLDAGGSIPLEIIAEPGRYVLRALPLEALPAQTIATLTVGSGLSSLAGDPMGASQSFSFTTRTTTPLPAMDLNGFYLAAEGGQLMLRAAAENLVSGTQLRVFNPSNGSGFATILTGADYSHVVDGIPGDLIELRSLDPAGNTQQRVLDVVKTGPDTYRLGNRPFSIRINEELILHVDEVLEGAGSELRLREADPAEVAARTAEVAALEAAPAMVDLQSIVASVDSGPFPRFKARLQLERNLDDMNGHALMPMSIQPGILAPANPETPDVVTENTLMTLHDAILIEDGAPAGTQKNRGVRNKFSLAGLMMTMEAASISGTIPTGDQVGTQVFIAIKGTSAPINGSEHPVYDYVECTRASVTTDPPIPVPNYQSAHWHDTIPAGSYPLPGTPVYEFVGGSGGHAPYYRLLAVSDATGRANCAYFGDTTSIRGVDPVTGQIEYAKIRTSDDAHHGTGFSLLTYSTRPLNFDPAQYQIDLGAAPPPTLKSRWEVGFMEDGEFVVEADQTTSLRERRRIKVDPTLLLKLTVQSSQSIATEPEPHLSTLGLTQPTNPELEGQSVIWTFPAGAALEGGLVEVTATIHSTHGTQNTITDRFMIIDDGPLADNPGAAPFVLYTQPEDEETDILVSDAVVVAFSEPVHDIQESTIQLYDVSDGAVVPVIYYDRNGDIITDAATESGIVHMVPREPLQFDHQFEIRVMAVLDREDTEPEETFTATFQTSALREVDQITAGYRTQIIGVKNLVLMLTENWEDDFYTISTYDTRNPREPMRLIGSQRMQKGVQDAFMRFQIFLPEEFEETGAGTLGDPNQQLDGLPGGSILCVTRQRFPSDVSHFELFRATGGGFDRLFGFDSLERGLCYDTAKMGKYLILAFKNFGYWAYEEIIPAKTVIYDILKMVDEFDALASQFGSGPRLELERDLQSLAVVAKYPLPGDVSSVTTFTRKEVDGDFTSIKPAFLLGGYYHPAIMDFDLSNQPPFPGLAMPSGDPRFDGRLVARTEYQDGESAMNQSTAAMPSLAYRDPVEGLREIDLAIFSERKNNHRILFFEVPREPGMSTTTIQPLKVLDIPDKLYSFALDRATGLLAIQGLDGSFSILDVKTFLETEPGDDLPGFQHPAFLFDAENKPLQFLSFIEGNLYGHRAGERVLTRTPVSPKSYRAVGWEYFDLAEWLNPADDAAEAENLTKRVKFAKQMVFYATDLPVNDTLTFTMEQGSYAIEIQGGGDIFVEFEDLTGGVTLDTIERRDLVGDSLERFAMTPVRDFYKNASRQRELRQLGYNHFRLKWRIEKDGVEQARDESDFIVAYRHPDTRYIDPHRGMGMLDGLALMPDLYVQDHNLSNNDARLNLSPSRAYHADYAFQPGVYGGGMLSGQMLYMALPVWWDIANLGDGGHDAADAWPRVVMEQPGRFQSSFQVDAGGLSATPLDTLADTLDRQGARWQFTNRYSMMWELLASEKLPEYRDVFEAVNHRVDETNRMRFPVFRYTAPNAETPPALLGETAVVDQKDLRYNNRIKFHDGLGRASGRPVQMKELVNDSGGQRINRIEYEVGPIGGHVVENSVADGLRLTYTYDDEGYLVEINHNGSRPIYYEWEPVGSLELGDFVVKRLSRIVFGSGGVAEEIGFVYDGADSLKVVSIQNNYGNKPVTVSLSDNGLPQTVRLRGIDAPDAGVNFADVGGQYLSDGYDLGASPFAISWSSTVRGLSRLWHKSSDSYRDQTMTYDSDGMLASRTFDQVIQESWVYENGGAFKAVPSQYIDALGKTFSISSTSSQIKTTADGIENITRLSSSGAPVGGVDVYGFRVGIGSSKFYNAFDGQNFREQNGRPSRTALPGRNTASGEQSYNGFGDVTRSVSMGVETQYNSYDAQGRPTQATLVGGVPQTYNYSYLNGRYVTTSTDTVSGREQRYEYNEIGNLMRWEETFDGVSRYYNFVYDDYGRLTSVVGSHQAGFVYRAVYDDLTEIPARVITPGEELIYSKADGGRITGLTRVIDGKEEEIAYETDLLGQETVFEEADLGVVRVSYDAFGRPVTRRQLDGGPDAGSVSYTYGDHSIQINDGINDLNTEVRYADDAGWNRTETISGAGVDTPRTLTTTTTVRSDGDGKGYRLCDSESGSGVAKTRDYDVLGNQRGASFGKYSFMAVDGAEDRYGQPNAFAGAWNENLDYDDSGRLREITNAHGHSMSLSYDAQDRVNAGSNGRGLSFQMDYLNSVYRDVSELTVSDVSLFQRDDRNGSSHQNWMGVTGQTVQEARAQTVKMLRGDAGDGSPLSATYSYERASGLLQSFEDFNGNTTAFTWSKGGRDMEAALPGGRRWSLKTDGFGQFRQFDMGAGRKIDVERDAADRVKKLQAGSKVFDFIYTGEDMTGIMGGPVPITYRNHNDQGMPTLIELGDKGTIEIEYHEGGIPACVIIKRVGRPAKVLRLNDQGDLVYMKRPHGRAVSYGHNQWGSINTMALDDEEPTTLYADGNPFSMNLPGGIALELDAEGRVSSIDAPGVAERTLEYDSNGSVATVAVDGVQAETYTSVGGRVLQMQSGTGEFEDTTDYTYDDQGRVTEIENDLDGVNSFTYPSEPEEPAFRVETYTAPNGVSYRYHYDDRNDMRRIDLLNGPTFIYDRDDDGNLVGVHVDGMGATFGEYVNGIPQSVTWSHEDGASETLQIEQINGRLRSVIGAGFSLEIFWAEPPPAKMDGCEGAAMAAPPMISSVVRGGPGYSETWSPTYDNQGQLIATTITRSGGGVAQTIEENYDSPLNRLLGGLRRTVDGQTVTDLISEFDAGADQRRVAGQTGIGGEMGLAYDSVGNMVGLNSAAGDQTLAYDGLRRLRRVETNRDGSSTSQSYSYDFQNRRISKDHAHYGEIVYAWYGSQVIAIGLKEAGEIRWTHAFGQGPAGPLFMRDLTHSGLDAFIFTDHLGTPFAWKQPTTGQVFYTPFNPWGELLAQQPGVGPLYADGSVPNVGFQLPPDPVFNMPPLGLGGHLYDEDTGLVYMHNRYYHPRLGHFTTADFRLPNIYDATSFTEPYAYATGNPIMFRDLDGRSWLGDTVGGWFTNRVDILEKTAKGFDDDNYFEVALSGLAGASAMVVDVIGSTVKLVDGAVEGTVENTLLLVDASGIRGEAMQQFARGELNAKIDSIKNTVEGVANMAEYAYQNPGEVIDKAVGVVEKAAENWENKSLTEKVFSGTKLVGDIVATVASGGATSANKIKKASDVVDTVVDTGRNFQKRGRDKGRDNPAKKDADIICDLPLCFAAGTPVLTPYGPKPIEQIRPGELVAARDEDTGETEWVPVSDTGMRENRQVRTLTVTNGDGMRESYTVTPEHPVWLENRGWVLVSELEEGDVLAGYEAEWRVTQLQDLEELTRVYNLEVAYVHNYFAGEFGLWVHNGGMSDCEKRKLRRDSPSQEIRDMVNPPERVGPHKDPALGAKFVDDVLEADHIVPLKKIMDLDGFDRLTYPNKKAVANLKRNFIGLVKSSNASKGAKTWAKWWGHKKSGTPVNPAFQKKMVKKERKARAALQMKINELLQKQGDQ